MRRYLHEYGWKHTDFAPFSINAHANGARNPNARLQEPISERDYTRARMVCDPINLLDASPIGDGAAAAVLVPAERVASNPRARILVAGSAGATDTLAVHDRKDPLFLSAAYHSARAAFAQAGLEPAQIDFFELHDAFSIMSALSLEACGFAERGQGPRLAAGRARFACSSRCPSPPRAGSRRAATRSAPPECTRLWRSSSSCGAKPDPTSSTGRGWAWPRTSAARAP